MVGRAALVVLLSGCSYLQIDRPPRAVRATDRTPGPACTMSRTWPTVDFVVAGVAVASSVGIAAGVIHPKQDNPDGTMTELSGSEKTGVIIASLIEGALFAWSGKYGYDATGACMRLQGLR